MERLIIQNDNQDKFYEYRYLYTGADNISRRSLDNTNRMLWRFSHDQNKKSNVTAVVWNPRYVDLFAVAYGTYDFGKKLAKNSICLFSIKNNGFPEMIIPVSDSVMCIEFNPHSPAILAAGLANGNVLVFDVRRKDGQPVYCSSAGSKKHTDIVWQIKWTSDPVKHSFFTVSADGKILNWTLMKDKLDCEEVFRLKFVDRKRKGREGEETCLSAYGSGLTIEFCPGDKFSFIVGTEEGAIHKCSSTYSGDYQFSYDGHQLAVYKLRFHPFLNTTFLSASADWTIKIWNLEKKQPLMSFDMGQPVCDAVWSPFNSTVMIGLADKSLSVFDLSVNRHMPVQQIDLQGETRYTNLAFNSKEPILLVGDSHGGTSAYKLGNEYANPQNLQAAEIKEKQLQLITKCIELGSMIN